MIDLRSDTVTKPSKGMMEAMFQAEVGDDVYKEDPTVNELERRVAELFGMDDALFFPTGSMANQAAIKMHTQPGEQSQRRRTCMLCCDLSRSHSLRPLHRHRLRLASAS